MFDQKCPVQEQRCFFLFLIFADGCVIGLPIQFPVSGLFYFMSVAQLVFYLNVGRVDMLLICIDSKQAYHFSKSVSGLAGLACVSMVCISVCIVHLSALFHLQTELRHQTA